MSEETLKRNLAAIAEAEKVRGSAIDLQARLRDTVQRLRRTPMPIAHVTPMLTEAADTIDRLQAQVAELQAKLK